MNYHSQHSQDYYIDLILENKNNGVFVDIGAHDGVTISNTYFFEQERNWSGICFEPMPEVFNELKKNRKCTVINAAIYTENTPELKFTRCHGYTEMLSGISEFRDDKHIERTKNEIQEYNGKVEEIIVKGVSFNQSLRDNNISEIDYISIDIEGGELEVLESIDFGKINITCLTVENNYQDKAIPSLLKKNNFIHISTYKCDDFFVSKTYYMKHKNRIDKIISEINTKQQSHLQNKSKNKTSVTLLGRIVSKIKSTLFSK